MSNDDRTRRLDTAGLVQSYTPSHERSAAPRGQPPRGLSTRPAPAHMALPQDDQYEHGESDIDWDEGEEDQRSALARLSDQERSASARLSESNEPERNRPVTRQPAPAVPVAASAADDTIELSRAYMVQGEPLKRFRMRKPVAREIGRIGNPLRFEIGDDGRVADVEARWDRVMKYITALSDPQIPPSSVEEFDYVDLDTCAAFLGPFFLRTTI